MGGICTSSDNRGITVDWDGTPVRLGFLTDAYLNRPLSSDEQLQLLLLLARRLRTTRGVAIADFVNRVLQGDEATNVKLYTFFGPGSAIVKADIGTSYVNICPGANGERIIVDLTGCTQFRFVLSADLLGVGQWGARCVRDGDSEVLIEQGNLGAAGLRELDSDWQALPAAFLGQGITLLRVQAKSTTATDDPVFHRCQMAVR